MVGSVRFASVRLLLQHSSMIHHRPAGAATACHELHLNLGAAALQANLHLKASAFRVERTFLIGLRAQKPETRQKFFALYNDLVPKHMYYVGMRELELDIYQLHLIE